VSKIYITQLIYIKEGQESTFHEFESLAIPTVSKYNGKLLLRTRPTSENVIENNIEVPYEIHFVEFDSQADFDAFKLDEERKKFLHLKEKAIRSVFMLQGKQV
jgi:uncharacterized protein (DUF1330 family)